MTATSSTPFQSIFDETKPFSSNGGMLSPAANVALSYTVPGESWQKFRAEFSFSENDYVWVALNKTAVIPTPGSAVSVNQQELRPLPKFVKGGDVLSFITTQANVQCGVSLLGLPSVNNS